MSEIGPTDRFTVVVRAMFEHLQRLNYQLGGDKTNVLF